MKKTMKIGDLATQQKVKVLVLVNSASWFYSQGMELVMPYLNHFGVPYDMVDIRRRTPKLDLASYPLILLAHPGVGTLGPEGADTLASGIKAVVEAGVGLVSFDPEFNPGLIEGRVFSEEPIGYSLDFGDTDHFITKNHSPNSSIKLLSIFRFLPLKGKDLRALVSSGGKPVVAVSRLGRGRIVHWASLDWMHTAILGPMAGMDDVFWRSIAWAARKPFVLRGLPPIVTMRVDDVTGTGVLWGRDPLYWVDVTNRYGFKPWLGLFIYNLTPRSVGQLRDQLEKGKATAFPHAFGRPPRTPDSGFWYNPKGIPVTSEYYDEFIYFNHNLHRPWSDQESARRLRAVDDWYADNPGLPISSYAVPHWYELGANTLEHIRDKWGCEFSCFTKDVDLHYLASAPWIKGGPFRLFGERGASNLPRPTYYADFVKTGGGTFFNSVTEIRDDAGYEWAPDSDIQASIGRGVRQLRRALDSMALASLFTHETDYIYKIRPEDWEAEIYGIADGIKDFNPIFMTCEEGMKVVRATRTSILDGAVYDSAAGTLRVEFSGKADTRTGMYVFTGEGDEVGIRFAEVPEFTKGMSVQVAL